MSEHEGEGRGVCELRGASLTAGEAVTLPSLATVSWWLERVGAKGQRQKCCFPRLDTELGETRAGPLAAWLLLHLPLGWRAGRRWGSMEKAGPVSALSHSHTPLPSLTPPTRPHTMSRKFFGEWRWSAEGDSLSPLCQIRIEQSEETGR